MMGGCQSPSSHVGYLCKNSVMLFSPLVDRDTRLLRLCTKSEVVIESIWWRYMELCLHGIYAVVACQKSCTKKEGKYSCMTALSLVDYMSRCTSHMLLFILCCTWKISSWKKAEKTWPHTCQVSITKTGILLRFYRDFIEILLRHD